MKFQLLPLLSIWVISSLLWSCQQSDTKSLTTTEEDSTAVESTVMDAQEWEVVTPDVFGFQPDELDEMLSYLVDSSNATGLAVIIDGKLVLNYGDIEELSYLASCRKSILAMLYGAYVENGTIDLNTTLADMGMDDRQGLMDIEKQATVDHLITARSGIYHPASNSGDNSADAPERGSQQPGEYFLYNNWDFNAAGFVFEKLTGKNIYDELERQLAIPLGFQDWDRSAQMKTGDLERSQYPAYHIWLSTRDMAKIGQLMLNKGKWNGEQIISEAWVEKISGLVTPVEEMNPERMKDREFGYGYMWWVWDGPNIEDHFEGAYSARGAWGQYITVIPKLNMVIAHKTKSDYRRSTSWSSYMGIVNRIVKHMN